MYVDCVAPRSIRLNHFKPHLISCPCLFKLPFTLGLVTGSKIFKEKRNGSLGLQ